MFAAAPRLSVGGPLAVGEPITDSTFARLRDDAVAIFDAAVAAVDPAALAARQLTRRDRTVTVGELRAPLARWEGPTLLVGAGKAAARMAAGCERALGAPHVGGEVIVADGCGVELAAIAVSEAGHPLPDARGERATRRIVERLDAHRAGGTLCVISGGASSLLVRPRPPLALRDTVRTTELLLTCGAGIEEINAVRKHLSDVKGGGLLRYAHTAVATLLLSDVVGDDPSTIGSGPTLPDPTTFADAYAALQRYRIVDQVPAAVRELLRNGMAGHAAETVKPQSAEAARSRHVVIGSNRTALDGAARTARARGWQVRIHAAPLVGETTAAARDFAAWVRERAREHPGAAPLCLLAGGETTVRVRGSGRGGRNQEFALAMAEDVAGAPIVVLSAGTDGIDGPTDAAGAFVDGTTSARARRRGLDPAAALAANDSYGFFTQLGDLYRCGPTGTNVMDLKIALVAGLPGPAGTPVLETPA